MKTIADIRIFKSDVENIDGNPLPSYINNKPLTVTVNRIVMKLREYKFSLGDFDHLYLNFTDCIPADNIMPPKRTADPYHTFYRIYDVGISNELFNAIEANESIPALLMLIKKALLALADGNEGYAQIIENAIYEATANGSEMLMRFKEKKNSKATAVIYLSYSDSEKYSAILCVYDLQGNEILKEKLPPKLSSPSSIGEILLSSQRVTVKPRKNAYSKNIKPISFAFKTAQ